MKKGIIFISVILAAAVVFYGIRFFYKPLNSVQAVEITQEEKVTAKAYIIREEQVYDSDITGTVYKNVDEGARVANNTLISTVYTGTVQPELLQELSVVDSKISEAKIAQSASGFTSGTTTDSNENQIENIKSQIITAAETNDIKAIRELKVELKELNGIPVSESESGTLSDFERQREQIENRIGTGKREITSSMAGVFTTFFDGMEDILTFDAAQNYTVADFKNLGEPQSYSASESIQAGQPVCKVVNNHVWYVMALVDMTQMGDTEVGDNVTVRFESIPGESVQMSIISISEQEGNEAVVMLESSRYLEGVYSVRMSNADIILTSHTGYEVPMSAVVENEGVQGVWAEAENVRKFYPVDILLRDTENGTYLVQSTEDAERKLEDAEIIILDSNRE